MTRSLIHGIILLVYTLTFCGVAPAGPCCPCEFPSGGKRCSAVCAEAREECTCPAPARGGAGYGESGGSAHESASGKCAHETGDYVPLPCRCALHAPFPTEKEHLAESKIRSGRVDPAMTVMAFDISSAGLSAHPVRTPVSHLSPPGGTLQHRCHILII